MLRLISFLACVITVVLFNNSFDIIAKNNYTVNLKNPKQKTKRFGTLYPQHINRVWVSSFK